MHGSNIFISDNILQKK